MEENKNGPAEREKKAGEGTRRSEEGLQRAVQGRRG